MSGYYDDEEPRRHRSHRSRRPVYEEEVVETRTTRAPASRQMDLVRRPRDESEDSIEEVRRDYIPVGAARRGAGRDPYAQPRARSVGRGGYYDDDYHGAPRRSDDRGGRRE
jgi:hypothetical protein